jgi:tetratricopeptide (TPR) repeat protein
VVKNPGIIRRLPILNDRCNNDAIDYYDGGHVLRPVKIENTLYAQVLGSAATPYEVRAYIDDKNMSSECSCPVGNMCKHGVALLLQWANDTSSFIDADKFIQTLENMNKDEIINVLKNIIRQNPSLVAEFSTETGEKPQVNIKAISDKISWIVSGELDYDHIWEAEKKLEEVKRSANRLMEEGSYKGAAEIYLALVIGAVEAYNNCVDDSDGGLGDFASGCIDDFNECIKNIADTSYKDELLENIARVEGHFLEKLMHIRKASGGFSYTYKKDKIIGLLVELYDMLGKPDQKLRLAQYELVNREDYIRLAEVLAQEERFEEALDAVKTGMALPEERTTHLSELYFDIAKVLVKDKPGLIDFKTSLEAALDMMSRQFDAKKYEKAKEVFLCAGKLDEFRSAIRTGRGNRDNAVRVFLHDGELNAAIEMIHAEPVSPGVIIEASSAAADKGLRKESAMLTRLVLERGLFDARPPISMLLDVMMDVSGKEERCDLTERILKMERAGTAILFLPYLMKKEPGLAARLAKKFLNDMPVELVAQVARAAPDDGTDLCMMRLNGDVLRSHVSYDKAVLLLAPIRDIYVSKGKESEWLGFIRRFAAENKGKKKLIEMVRKEFGVVL